MKYQLFWILIYSVLVSCQDIEPRRPVSASSSSFINESIQRNKKRSAEEEAAIQEIITKDKDHTYLTSEHGFWYYYNSRDTLSTIKPKFGDEVVFDYSISDIEGNTIYPKKTLSNIVYRIDKEDLFYGLREGLKLMRTGETMTFLFPSYHAFGYYGDNDKIGTNIPIRSTVTLHSIQSASTLNDEVASRQIDSLQTDTVKKQN